jgi:hypothetical protein
MGYGSRVIVHICSSLSPSCDSGLDLEPPGPGLTSEKCQWEEAVEKGAPELVDWHVYR